MGAPPPRGVPELKLRNGLRARLLYAHLWEVVLVVCTARRAGHVRDRSLPPSGVRQPAVDCSARGEAEEGQTGAWVRGQML